MERNELIDGLRNLSRGCGGHWALDAAIEELNSDVEQVLRLEAVIRVLKQHNKDHIRIHNKLYKEIEDLKGKVSILNADAGAYVTLAEKKHEEIEDLKRRLDNMWNHLSKAWQQWHDQQRKLNHANFQAKEDRLKATDAMSQAGFFLRQLRKFGLGYSNIDYDMGSLRDTMISRDTKTPHPQATCPHGISWDSCTWCRR